MYILEQNDIVIFLCVFLPNWGHRSLKSIFTVAKTVSDTWQEMKKSKSGKDKKREELRTWWGRDRLIFVSSPISKIFIVSKFLVLVTKWQGRMGPSMGKARIIEKPTLCVAKAPKALPGCFFYHCWLLSPCLSEVSILERRWTGAVRTEV